MIIICQVSFLIRQIETFKIIADDIHAIWWTDATFLFIDNKNGNGKHNWWEFNGGIIWLQSV